eukprot:6197887-Pleurochrysis_carterae.AAC.2
MQPRTCARHAVHMRAFALTVVHSARLRPPACVLRTCVRALIVVHLLKRGRLRLRAWLHVKERADV